MDEQLDPEMLKHIEMLLDMDVLEGEAEWPILENLDEAEQEQEK